MTDFTRRTLRTWAVAEAVYAIVVASLVIGFVPWKTPVLNASLLLFAALHGFAAPGMYRLRRWGYRLSLLGGILAFVVAVIACSGLFATWAYLRAIYGDFGRGASIAALLLAGLALQFLGLYPALKLRALLRREVRADLGTGPGLGRALLGLCALPLLVAAVVSARYRLDPFPPVAQEGREQAVMHLEAALRGMERPELPALVGVPAGAGPVRVTLWRDGAVARRVTGTGEDLNQAVRSAARKLAAEPGAGGPSSLRIDRIAAVGPVFSEAAPILALSVNAGKDGLRRRGHAESETLLPDDLLKLEGFGAAPLVPGIRELRLGLDAGRVLERLGPGPGALERVRAESWLGLSGRALPVVRGNTPGPGRGASEWRSAAVSGGDFVLRQIMPDGRFHYQYFPLRDWHSRPGRYSLPRHAGTVYALAQLYGFTGQQRFRLGAEKAIRWLVERVPQRCGRQGRSCVVDRGRAWLGGTALALVGLLEHQRNTGDRGNEETSRRLLEFLLDMQRRDGDFHHLYVPGEDRTDHEVRRMFYSSEAALALVMAHDVLGDERYLRSAEKALDYLTGPKYDYFLGRFIFGDDHWTCIAAEEAWPQLQTRRYLDFCRAYCSFLRRIQYRPSAWSNDDFRGHYGFPVLAPPPAGATSSATEAALSTYALAEHHGLHDREIREQVVIALDALVRDQIRADNSWLMPNPGAAAGGIRRSLVEQDVRIDFTQHAASALVRGAQLLREEGPEFAP